MNTIIRPWVIIISLLGLSLTACSKGGGDNSGDNPDPKPPELSLTLALPSATPLLIPPSGIAANVTFMSVVSGNAVPPVSLFLDEMTASGVIMNALVTYLHDDGERGDQIRGDRIYSGQVALSSIEARERFFRVRAIVNGASVTSPTMAYWISGCPAASRPSDPQTAVADTRNGGTLFANELLIRTETTVPPDLERINNVVSQVNGHVVGCIPTLRQYLIEIPGDGSAQGIYNAIDTLVAHPDIAAAFPNAQTLALPQADVEPSLLCNGIVDTQCQWYLDRVRAQQAWQLAGGGDPQKGVAIIDFGVDCRQGELPCDADVFTDDPIDHGTGVAGIIGSRKDSGGMAGVAWNTHLYPYSFLGNAGSQYKMNELITAAMSQVDVRVINISAATTTDIDGQIKHALCAAIDSGRLVVAAAGNPTPGESAACEQTNIYPARYNEAVEMCGNGTPLREGLLVVGASDINNNLASWRSGEEDQCSNQRYVDVYAPGKDIITLSTQHGYTTKSGTSYAAPLVSGAASVVWSTAPQWTPAQLHTQLINSASLLTLSTINPRVQTGDTRMVDKPLLDIYRAVGGQDAIAVPDTAPDDFSITPHNNAPLYSWVVSEAIVIQGIDSPSPIQVGGGFYSINDGVFTQSAGSVRNGEHIRLQLRSADSPSTPRQAEVTIGGQSRAFHVTTRAPLTEPGQFEFVTQPSVPPNTPVLSNTQTITGIDPGTPISISGENAEYSIDGSAFTNAPGTIGSGQTVQVRITPGTAFNTPAQATLTIGSVSSVFNVTTLAADTTPNVLILNPQTDVAPGSDVTSNTLTVSGINAPALISISAGQYAVNGGAFTTLNGYVNNGDTVQVRLNASSASGMIKTATLSIGGISSVFSVTTVVLDSTPDGFAFNALSNLAVNTVTQSNLITVSGINTPAPISISGATAEYALNGGTFTNQPGTVNNGDSVRVRITTADTLSTVVNAVLTIGGVSAVFSVATEGADITPDNVSFAPRTDVPLNAVMESEAVTITGINTAAPISIAPLGEYAIGTDNVYTPFTNALGSINADQTVKLRLNASATPNTTLTTTLTIGELAINFSVTTLPAYLVSTSVSNGGSIAPLSVSVIQGASANFIVLPNTGFNVALVTGCGGTQTGNSYTTAAITAACTVTANFVIKSYAVTATAGSGGTITPANTNVNHGSSADFTVTPDTGFSIDSVSGCNGARNGNTYTTGAITSPCAVNATFIPSITATADTTPQHVLVGQVMADFKPLTANNGKPPYVYSFSGTLPQGVVFNAASGIVNGSPTAPYATANIVFSVRDALNETAVTTSTVSFSVEAVDATPNSFSIAPQSNAPLNTLIESQPFTVTGINVPVSISISSGEFSIEGGSFVTSGTVTNGQSIVVRLMSAATLETVTLTTLTIGGVSGDYSVTTEVGVPVAALFINNGANWNDYVKGDALNTATDVACEPGIDTACIHAGMFRVVDVDTHSNCTGLTASDALGVFDWTCDASSGIARFMSVDFAEGKHLSDLIDFAASNWKSNSVTVFDNGSPLLSSTPQTWWQNPVIPAGDGSALLDSEGTIYVVGSTINLTSGYQIAASKVGLVSNSGSIIQGPGTSTHLVSVNNMNFIWLEVTLDAANDSGGILLNQSNFSRLVHCNVSNSILATGNFGIKLQSSNFNQLDNINVSNHFFGLQLLSSLNNTLTKISAFQNSNTGINIGSGSSDNYLNIISSSNNGSNGLTITSASNNNYFEKIVVSSHSNSFANGIGVFSGSGNKFVKVSAVNNDRGISLGQGLEQNVFSQILLSNNREAFIFGLISANNNIFSQITVNSSTFGPSLKSGNNFVVTNVLSVNNQEISIGSNASYIGVVSANSGGYGVSISGESRNLIIDVSSSDNALYGIRLINSSRNQFSGLLQVGNNISGDCLVTFGLHVDPGLDDDSNVSDVSTDDVHTGVCMQQGLSNFGSAVTGISLVNSFVGKINVNDAVNVSDNIGVASFPTDIAAFDWTQFENEFRSWGKDGGSFPSADNRGKWIAGAGRIWDWSLLATDTVLRNRRPLPTGNDTILHTWSDASTVRFLLDAVEIMGDGIGNDNALCESNETCLWTPNLTSYQGHGPLVSAGFIGAGGTISNVQLMKYEFNGY